MKALTKTPAQSLNKAYQKQAVTRQQINLFKNELRNLFNQINENQGEDYHKNCIRDFLNNVYYKDKYLVNINDNQDLVILHGNTTQEKVGVIFEFKTPSFKKNQQTDMITKDELNVKSFHQLILYYLQEKLNQNHQIKNLIITNIYDWFIFDEDWFEKNVFKNSNLRNQYEDWLVANKKTEHFYKNIAHPFLENLKEDVPCTYFNLKELFEKINFNEETESDNQLIIYYKIFSPEHLLKKSFANDSNTLNKEFYNELLYILGLEEKKEGANKFIQRKSLKERLEGSFLENTIAVLEKTKKIEINENDNSENKLFEISLELCITWLNRILFLKLLEGQLVNYHKVDREKYLFLNTQNITCYNDFEELFFDILAIPFEERKVSQNHKFVKIPYLNSSLFEQTEFEQTYMSISQLRSRELPIYSHTVLKDIQGKKIVGKKTTIQYLLEFLNAYNFSSDSPSEIQEENKTIVNSSVLGLIFEKINGYKEGSFFTPSTVTMYMCKQTIQRSVIQKFNQKFQWNCQTLEELKEEITSEYKKDKSKRIKFNEIINSIKICDPSVGSGHFLVSALNELILIKSELDILCYRDNTRITEYNIHIENDELIFTDVEDESLFNYRLNQLNKPIDRLQKLQEAIFHEKQYIIENCLFGVDINPKSVIICRLRLWIELLKNAYYTKESQYKYLETLPNIDINIKCGNSLISRFSLNDKNSILPKERDFVKELIEKYKILVKGYKITSDKTSKDTIRKQIQTIKNELQKFTLVNDQDYIHLKKKEGELYKKQTEIPFGGEKERTIWREEIEKLANQVIKVKKIYEDKLKSLYSNSMEWRFEFPEILDEDGHFLGFDLVIGNPPYGVSLKGELRNKVVELLNKVPDYEIYYLFINLSYKLLSNQGYVSYIIPNTLLFNVFAKQYRLDVLKNWGIIELIDCTDFKIFQEATVRNLIFIFNKSISNSNILYIPTSNIENLEELFSKEKQITNNSILEENIKNWGLVFRLSNDILELKVKIKTNKIELSKYFPEFSQGLIAYDQYKGQSHEVIENRIFHSFEKKDGYKIWLWGEDVTRYSVKWNQKEWINYDIKDIANPREPKYFVGKRVLIREITNPRIFAGFTEDECYHDPAIIVIKENQKNVFSLFTLLGILNSKLATFYHFNSSPKSTKGEFPKILVEDIKDFPLPIVSEATKEIILQIENNVVEILKLRKIQQNSLELEAKIDKLVYQLYNITEDEQKIIESKIS
jgi:hypothetical protein